MAQLSQLSSVSRDEWETTSVESVMTTDLPAGSPSWTVRDAVVAMEAADVEVLAVTDSAGNFIGVVTEDDVVRLGEILEETEGTEG
jgi:CBS domain-containing protein